MLNVVRRTVATMGGSWMTPGVHALARDWRLLALRGALAIAFGIAALAWPGLTVYALVLLFGAYALVDGAVAVLSVVRHQAGDHRALMMFEGIVGIVAGIGAAVWPGITALALVLLIGVYAVLTGIVELVAAARLRGVLRDDWALGLAGILSIAFGAAMIAFPGAGALAVAWLIGAYAIAFGAAMLTFAVRLRGLQRLGGARAAA